MPLLPKHKLGRTGREVSAIGLGGLVFSNLDQNGADKVIADSIAVGVNYFDVSPTYGTSEITLGNALKPHRENAFLACKTTCRDRKGSQLELENSLKRLQTDYFDLYQFHGIADVEKDVNAMLGKNGAIETFLKARDAGIIRNIGFTAHSKQAALAAIAAFDFDTMVFPINFVSHYKADTVTEVIAEAKKRDMGIIAIKAMAKGQRPKDTEPKYPRCWYEPIDDPKLAKAALAFSFDQGAMAALPPCDERLYRLALNLATEPLKISPQQTDLLKKTAQNLTPVFDD